MGSYNYQGASVSISADGSTVIIGGPTDNYGTAAAWIFAKTGCTWTQQGSKLVGTGFDGTEPGQGTSVSISADGKTAIIGGPYDNGNIGAAWIYTRKSTSWTQQGSKLVGTDYSGTFIEQGTSVSISADGNTAIICGHYDNDYIGAAWIFTRRGTTLTQQGTKLVGTGYIATEIHQGTSVSISSDGNTVIIGGPYDNNLIGAAWIFTRKGTSWTQQGSKLVGTGFDGSDIKQGWSVSISSDTYTAIIGAPDDNNSLGAAWVLTRKGNVWTQQGTKLVGTGYNRPSKQGWLVSLDSHGNTAIIGGWGDNSNSGAAWIFTRSGSTWTQQLSKLVGTGFVGSDIEQGFSVSISADSKTAISGGPFDNNSLGSLWVFNLG